MSSGEVPAGPEDNVKDQADISIAEQVLRSVDGERLVEVCLTLFRIYAVARVELFRLIKEAGGEFKDEDFACLEEVLRNKATDRFTGGQLKRELKRKVIPWLTDIIAANAEEEDNSADAEGNSGAQN